MKNQALLCILLILPFAGANGMIDQANPNSLQSPFENAMGAPASFSLSALPEEVQAELRIASTMWDNHTETELNQTGDHTHMHGGVQGIGLDAVWATPLHGTVLDVRGVDVDGIDAIIATDMAILAIANQEIVWARHIGNIVRIGGVWDVDGNGDLDVVYGTSWNGQTPRVEALQISDGHLIWQTIFESSILKVGPLGGGSPDVLAVDAAGTAYRLAGPDGSNMWSSASQFDATLGVAMYAFGATHALVGDVTGDGVADATTVRMWMYSAYVPFVASKFNIFYTIESFDGATGESVVLYQHGGVDPAEYHMVIPRDVTLIEADNEAGFEVAASYSEFRFIEAAFFTNSGFEVLDAQGPSFAPQFAAMSPPLPLLSLQGYYYLEAADMFGDSREELLVSEYGIVNNGVYAYAADASRDDGPEHAGGVQVTDGFLDGMYHQFDGDEKHVFAGSSEAWMHILPDGSIEPSTHERPWSVNGELWDGNSDRVTMANGTLTLGKQHSRFDMHDVDGDNIEDLVYVSYNAERQFIDGLTGAMSSGPSLNIDVDAFANGYLYEVADEAVVMYELNGSKIRTTPFGGDYAYFLGSPFDANGDGWDDFTLRTYGFDNELILINGRTGATMWTLPIQSLSTATPGYVNGDVDSILIFDSYQDVLIIVDASTGDVRKQIGVDFYGVNCAVGADLDGDGTAEYYVSSWSSSGDQFYKVTDKLVPIQWAPNSYTCRAENLDDKNTIAIVGYQNERSEAIVRDGEGTVFETDGLGFIDIVGITGESLYYSREDHVYRYDLRAQEQDGEYVFDGPFVRTAMLMNVDGKGESELLVLGGDGIVWAISPNAEAVRSNVAKEAGNQGKELPGGVQGVQEIDPSKDSPLGVLPILLVAVLLLAKRRHNR